MTNVAKLLKLLTALLPMVTLIVWGCPSSDDGKRTPQAPALKLTMAVQPTLFSGLIAIADKQGFFKEEGLEVVIHLHPTGRASLEQVCLGQAQVATVADIAFAAKAFEDPSIRVLASIGTTLGSQIVARKDRGIQKPSDLKGKRVAFTAGTANDYFLYSFLITENIPQKDVAMVDIPAARQVEALVKGEVDAISTFETYAFEAKKQLGANVIAWDSQNEMAYHWFLAFRESLVPSPEPLKRLFKALIRAEAFAVDHEEEAKRIISQKWDFDPAFMQQFWSGTRLDISFSQSIVTALQNYTRWYQSKVDPSAVLPDVIDFLHTSVLDAVAPESVTIYR
jgi:NitT/TauT family transport system substrate-binding protein